VELFAGFEADGFTGSDAYFGSCAGVTAHAGFAGFDVEDAEAAQFDAVAAAEGVFHGFEDCIDSRFGLDSGKPGSLYYTLDEVLLYQWVAFLDSAGPVRERYDLRP
jgi:hypothetical protein